MTIKGKQILNNTINNNNLYLSTPLNDKDAATKQYVDEVFSVLTPTQKLNTTNKNMAANDTSSGSGYVLACNSAVTNLPVSTSEVIVYINGIKINHGLNQFCIFSGITLKDNITTFVTQGDYLYWNKNIATYNLDINDTITFDYLVSIENITGETQNTDKIYLENIGETQIVNKNNLDLVVYNSGLTKWENKNLNLEYNNTIINNVNNNIFYYSGNSWITTNENFETTLYYTGDTNMTAYVVNYQSANTFYIYLNRNLTTISFSPIPPLGYELTVIIIGNGYTFTNTSWTNIGADEYEQYGTNIFNIKFLKPSTPYAILKSYFE